MSSSKPGGKYVSYSKITDEETKREQLFLTPTMTTESNVILTNGDPLLRPPEDKTSDKLAR